MTKFEGMTKCDDQNLHGEAGLVQEQLRILRHRHPHPGPLPSGGRGRMVLRR
jgi:hypothetical protein